jgi:hypothetical protein
MDFQEIWGKPEEATPPLPDRAALAEMLGKESLGLLAKLRRQLRIKMYLGIGTTLLFSPICLFANDQALVWLSLGIMTFMSVLLLGGVYYHYRRLPDHLDMSQGMLPLLKAYETIVRKALRFEERVGAFFIIPAPALGALLGASMGSGKPLEAMLTNESMLLTLLIVTVLFAPLAIWGSIWMNRVAFGKALDGLRRNIVALEEM